MQQKRLRHYKYKKTKLEEDFSLEDYLTDEELSELLDLL